MNTSQRFPLPTSVSGLVFGLGAGFFVLFVAVLETRWVVYLSAGVVFFAWLFMIRDQQRFLWIILVLGLQLDVSLRVMHGHAGSIGIGFPFSVLMGVVFMICFLLTREPRDKLRLIGPLGPALVLIFGIFAFSAMASNERFVAFTAIVTYIEFYFLYFVAYNFVTREDRLETTVKLLLTIVLVQSLVYFVQSKLGITFTLTGEVLLEGAVPRPGGTVATTPASFAMFMFPLILIAAAFTASQRVSYAMRWWTGVLSVLGAAALVLTFTRGAWAAFALGLLWLVAWGTWRKMISGKLVVLMLILVCVVGTVLVPFVLVSRQDNPLDSAFDERVALMEMAVNVIKANPITGVGPGAYPHTYKTYLTPELRDKWLFTVHNTYLLMMAELGLAGGLALVVWLVSGIVFGLRMARDASPLGEATGIGCSAAFVALAFELFWEPMNGLHGMSPLIPYWFLLGLMAGMLSPRARQSTESRRNPAQDARRAPLGATR